MFFGVVEWDGTTANLNETINIVVDEDRLREPFPTSVLGNLAALCIVSQSLSPTLLRYPKKWWGTVLSLNSVRYTRGPPKRKMKYDIAWL